MQNLKQLKEEILEIETLKNISSALGEVATLKLRRNRQRIQKNIDFFREISNVYQQIKTAAQRSKKELNRAPKNGRTISVLLCSNYKFYGGLDRENVSFFVFNTAKYRTDRLVIGKVGAERLLAIKYPEKFSRILFKKDIPTDSEFKLLKDFINPYSRILFFHSKFITVMDQQPVVTDISPQEVALKNSSLSIDFMLEPEVDKMLSFFENQILGLLIDSIFLESEIARTASRMIAMDQAQLNADKLIKNENIQMLKLEKLNENRKIIETFATKKQTKVML